MEQTIGWARIWPAARRVDDVTLRQGAWYPVLSSGAARIVLEVSGRRVAVPPDVLEIRPRRPDRFTVVYRTWDDPNPARGTSADMGRVYAVCPKCACRVWVPSRDVITSGAYGTGRADKTTCDQCGHKGDVAWWETG